MDNNDDKISFVWEFVKEFQIISENGFIDFIMTMVSTSIQVSFFQ